MEPKKLDDPAFHQGRSRAQPGVVGDWPTHVYIDISLEHDLHGALTEIYATVVKQCPRIRSLLLSEYNVPRSLHISLSPPIQLKHSQIPLFTQAMQAFRGPSFTVSLDELVVLDNDNKTRQFLAAKLTKESTDILQPVFDHVTKCSKDLDLAHFEVSSVTTSTNHRLDCFTFQ